ncbi:GNAT family N-acetyltransferase [Qipengyuania zhejiangensis]|uniref:GNAT family N-acetyltransferase n=1 Tax=Qipengyuania zhejiangensis TaxID=3077782 RepID=UPI002D76EA4A|nr:GNAT family N-acetyltransferase [Qipengyuania sp. Z2]
MTDSTDITIEREGNDSSGAYVIKLSGVERRAELTWVARDGVRHANHTFVPDEMRGKGIAAKLVDALIADAREQGFTISPDCSYVAGAFRRNPDWSDLRA